jgi:hypothetical protein
MNSLQMMQNVLYWHHLPFIALPQKNCWIIGPAPCCFALKKEKRYNNLSESKENFYHRQADWKHLP